jgi:hypothetical protein
VAATLAPAPPQGLQVTIAGTTATLGWSPAHGAKAYQLVRIDGPGTGFRAIGAPLTATTAVDTSLVPGGAYAWRVLAGNDGGWSQESASAAGVTQTAGVTNLQAMAATGVVLLSWSPAYGASGYRVSRTAGSAGPVLLATVGNTSYTDAAAPAGPKQYLIEPVSAALHGAPATVTLSGDGEGHSVVARSTVTWISDGADVRRPEDFTSDRFVLWSQDSAGAWASFPGFGSKDGVLVFLNVPDGPYLIARYWRSNTTPWIFASSERTLDLSNLQPGRFDQVYISDDHTGASATVSNLTPWRASADGSGDWLELISAGGDTWAASADTLPTGATSGTLQIPSEKRVNGLISGQRGDIAWLLHDTTQTTSGPTVSNYYVSLSDWYQTSSYEMAAGAFAPLTAVMAPAPTVSGTVTLLGSQYAALRQQMGAADANAWDTVSAFLQPGTAHGYYTSGATLFSLDELLSVHGNQDSDRTLPALTWGDPFPSAGVRIGSLRFYFRQYVNAPGTPALPVFPAFEEMQELGAFLAAEHAPRLGPVQQLAAAGKPLGLGNAGPVVGGVGLTPRITWTAPSLGSPDFYLLRLFEVAVASGVSRLVGAGLVSVKASETAVQLPPGLLQQGHLYVLEAEASTGGFAANLSPFQDSEAPIDGATTSVWSGLFTP